MKKFKTVWNNISYIALPLIVGIILVICWETSLLNIVMNVNQSILPPPSRIINVVIMNFSKYLPDINETLIEILVGLFIGSILGYLLAVFASVFPKIGKGGITLVTAFNAIPIIALTPVVLNLVRVNPNVTDADSRSLITKIIVVILVSMSSMSITAFRGLTDTKPFAVDLLHSYACGKTKILFKLRIPNSIPYVFTALKIGIPTAVISALVSEYFTEVSRGIGYKIKSNAQLMQYSTAWAYIFIACCIGIILYAILMIVQGIVLRNRKA